MRKTIVLLIILIVLVVGCARAVQGEFPMRSATGENFPATVVTSTSAPAPTAILLTQALTPTSAPTITPTFSAATEQAIQPIPLAGPAASADAEYSGMAWYGETLILAPQYPDFAGGSGDGVLYGISKATIRDYLAGRSSGPIQPFPIELVAPGLDNLPRYEGFEAIAFAGNRVFLTVEVEASGGSHSFVVSGEISPDLAQITLDTENLLELPALPGADNKSDESLVIAGNTLFGIYEVNGASVNPSPVAHVFDFNLGSLDAISFPSIEYRVTDATTLDGSSRFWVINYFFPGEANLMPAGDPLADLFFEPPTHQNSEIVERLVELQYTPTGIMLTSTPPIYLALAQGARNWEGLVRFDNQGFLLVTDKFPETILAYVDLP